MFINFFVILQVAFAEIYLDAYTYQGIESAACTRLLTAQGMLGCSSKSQITSGVLYQIADEAELNKFITTTTGNFWSVVMPASLLTQSNLDMLVNRVAGILLVKDFLKPLAYSLDATVPNLIYGLYKNEQDPHIWNPNGANLLSKSFDIPIFELLSSDLSNTATNNIYQAVTRNIENEYKIYPLYAMDFRNLMNAEINAHRCLTRETCDPVGERSVWSTFSSNLTLSDPTKPLIMVSAKLDATALVRDLGTGASSKASVAVLLAVVEALSRSPTPMRELPKSIIFTFFGGETWAFGGSSRFVKDISNSFVCLNSGTSSFCPVGKCSNPCVSDTDFTNMNINNIESIIEFDTVGLLHEPLDFVSNVSLYIHVDKINPKVNELVQEFTNQVFESSYNSSLPIQISILPSSGPEDNKRLPPSSIMSFLAERPDIPAILISDYQSEYSNQYFNSEFDDGSTWTDQNIALLCGVANTTAKSLYKLASGENAPAEISVNCTKVFEYVDCFTRNISCSLMQQFLPNSAFEPVTSAYSSVFNFKNKPKPLTFLVNRILNNLTASSRAGSCKRDRDCSNDEICILGSCILSLTRYHNAYGKNANDNLGTGIEFDYEKGFWKVVDSERGTFVESRYAAAQIRVYLVTSLAVQLLQLGFGVVVTGFTAYIIIYWDKLSENLA